MSFKVGDLVTFATAWDFEPGVIVGSTRTRIGDMIRVLWASARIPNHYFNYQLRHCALTFAGAVPVEGR